MQNDREKWNSRYAGNDFFLGKKPSSFLQDNIDLVLKLCAGRRALDLACGEGRNSIFLARHGFEVTGIDIADVGIAKAGQWAESEHLAIDFRREDLDTFCLQQTFDLIINFNFLVRRFFTEGYERLAPRGVMIIDTILDSPFVPTPHQKGFLLRPGELLHTFTPLDGSVLHFEEHPLVETPTAKILFWKHVY